MVVVVVLRVVLRGVSRVVGRVGRCVVRRCFHESSRESVARRNVLDA